MDVPLSKEGWEQASAVADWFANQPTRFGSIYSSDLARAAQTASVIGSRLEIEPQFSPALREIHCGEWQGLSVSEVETRYPGQLSAWDADVENFTLPGGECVLDVQHRVSAFYRQLVEGHVGEALMLVSHGLALSALQAAIHGWNIAETWKTARVRLGNTGVTAIKVNHRTGKIEVLFSNSTAHLPGSDIPTVMDRD